MFLQQRGFVPKLRLYVNWLRTRLTQGLGHYTRDENDYALVLMSSKVSYLKCVPQPTMSRASTRRCQTEIAFEVRQLSQQNCRRVYKPSRRLSRAERGLGTREQSNFSFPRGTQRHGGPKWLERSKLHLPMNSLYIYALWRHDFEHAYNRGLLFC